MSASSSSPTSLGDDSRDEMVRRRISRPHRSSLARSHVSFRLDCILLLARGESSASFIFVIMRVRESPLQASPSGADGNRALQPVVLARARHPCATVQATAPRGTAFSGYRVTAYSLQHLPHVHLGATSISNLHAYIIIDIDNRNIVTDGDRLCTPCFNPLPGLFICEACR